MKTEKNEIKNKYNKDIEEEKNRVRIGNIEKDKLELAYKDIQDQLHKLRLVHDSKLQEFTNLKKDLESSSTSLESAEVQIGHLREEIAELQRKIFEKETQSENKIREIQKIEKEKYLKDKDEKEKLQKSVDELEQKNRELASSFQSQERELKHDLERKKQENNNIKEDLRLQESKNSAISRELEMYKTNANTKNEEIERLQSEFRSLTIKYNEVSKNFEISNGRLQQFGNKFEKTGENKNSGEENKHLEEKIKNLEANNHFFKQKAREYKEKVKQGNEKIQELGIKLAKSEIERQKLLGIKPGTFEKDQRFELKGQF